MTTLKNAVLCVLATIIASPAAAFVINFAIDALVWLDYFAGSIGSMIIQKSPNDIGWVIISASIAKFSVPFVGTAKIVEIGNGSKYTWPPAVSFFLFAAFLAIHNVYFLMTVASSS